MEPAPKNQSIQGDQEPNAQILPKGDAWGTAKTAKATSHRTSNRTANMSTQIWLYRYYDEFGRLLYIGITTKLKDRNRSHRKYSNWYVKSVTSTSECCSTYIEALAREKTAIKAEKPIYNITHNNNNPQRKQKEPSGILPNALFLYHAYVERCLDAKNCINLMMNLSLPTNEYLRHMVNRGEVRRSGKNLTITNDFVLFTQRKS